MFAILGEILFETLTSPQGFRASTKYIYAEHQVVEAPPRLQWLTDGLERISLDLGFHAAFTNPKTQMDALRAAANDHQARALVFGNGIHRGYFIIEEIEEIHQQSADDGSFVSISARIQLREWVPGSEFDPNAAARMLAAAPGIVVQAIGGSSLEGGTAIAAPSPTIAGLITAFNPNQSIGPSNPTPSSSILQLSQPGAEQGLNYSWAKYESRGVSGILSSPSAGSPPAQSIQPADVLPSNIVRAAN